MLAPLSGIEPAKLKKLKFSFTPKNSGIRGEGFSPFFFKQYNKGSNLCSPPRSDGLARVNIQRILYSSKPISLISRHQN